MEEVVVVVVESVVVVLEEAVVVGVGVEGVVGGGVGVVVLIAEVVGGGACRAWRRSRKSLLIS